MSDDLVKRLRGGKCPHCKGWGEVAYFGEMVRCACQGKYASPLTMKTRELAADRIEALEEVRDYALAFVNAYDNPDGPAFVKLGELRAALARAALKQEKAGE